MSEVTTVPGVVLIADDNPEARRMLDVRVKREGHRTIMVENGQEALDVLSRELVDVILLDIEMPVLNGYAVLAAVRGDPLLAHIPVLIISGGGDQDDVIRCIEMGAVDYLPKPFNQAILRARISSCIAQKRQRDQERSALPPSPPNPPSESITVSIPGGSTWQIPSERSAGPAYRPVPRGTVPAQLGRITLGRLLGTGGMGEVYLGHHELLDLQVAVKLMRPELTAMPNARERLLREARLAARLAHRHIVRLLEVGETENGVHLAFEYISGGTLAEMLNRQPSRQLPIATAIRITTQVAAALAAANALGIIHRDIKPANLLLTPEGEVRVGDFGLAKQELAKAVADSLSTMDGIVVGTPLYMAPEQLLLGSRLDVRTDLYALGGVLYEMLVGQTPFGNALPAAPTLVGGMGVGHDIFHHITHTTPVPPSRFRPDVPEWLDALCLKLLAKSPDDRFASPETLLTALVMATPVSSEATRP
ncbi:MAG: protein kinase [Planctomycetes bacterium]|nr:protein kinase [Planctomycetota bacterium]